MNKRCYISSLFFLIESFKQSAFSGKEYVNKSNDTIPDLYGLRYMHLVNLNAGEAAASEFFILFFIVIEKISGIHTHADRPLEER